MGRLAGMSPGAFSGRVAVVTGSASGIGAAALCRLRAEGATVVALDMALETEHTWRNAIRCDVTDLKAVAEAGESVAVRFGRCDVVVNAAGVAPVGDALACHEADWDQAFAVNAKGTWLVCRTFLPLMIRGGGGAIVNVASGAALRATPGMAAYSASKAAVVALTRSIALDYAVHGVRANALCPGPVDTPLHHRTVRLRQELGQVVSSQGGLPSTMATVDEMAEYILMLARPQSVSLTGSALVADGGRVMH